jgi:hypothetical protein
MSEGVKCVVCDGRGFLDDAEPEEYFTSEGNSAIRFKPLKLQCPNPDCHAGFILPEGVEK